MPNAEAAKAYRIIRMAVGYMYEPAPTILVNLALDPSHPLLFVTRIRAEVLDRTGLLSLLIDSVIHCT